MAVKISILIQFDTYNTMKLTTSSLSTPFSIFRTGGLDPSPQIDRTDFATK